MFKIKDNYLSLEEHIVLKTNIESDYFPLYYNSYKINPNKKLFD